MAANFLAGPSAQARAGGVAAVPQFQGDPVETETNGRESDGTEYMVAGIVTAALLLLVLMNKGGFKAMAAVNVGGS